MSGKVGTLPVHSECPLGTWQSLCCATGTQYGTCQWRGYGGLAMDCRGGCEAGETPIAQNSNPLEYSPVTGYRMPRSCFLGYQTFCCSDFEPPVSMPQLNLLGEDGAWSDVENVDGWSEWRIVCLGPLHIRTNTLDTDYLFRSKKQRRVPISRCLSTRRALMAC
jgi:hypothetical protein